MASRSVVSPGTRSIALSDFNGAGTWPESCRDCGWLKPETGKRMARKTAILTETPPRKSAARTTGLRFIRVLKPRHGDCEPPLEWNLANMAYRANEIKQNVRTRDVIHKKRFPHSACFPETH